MANTRRSSASAPAEAVAVVLALIAASLLLGPAEASTLTVFKGPGCSGKSKDINYVCGCYDIRGYQGGFHFVFTEGQQAYLHNSPNCGDHHPVHLKKETRYCQPTGFKSVKMIC